MTTEIQKFDKKREVFHGQKRLSEPQILSSCPSEKYMYAPLEGLYSMLNERMG